MERIFGSETASIAASTMSLASLLSIKKEKGSFLCVWALGSLRFVSLWDFPCCFSVSSLMLWEHFRVGSVQGSE